MLVTDPLVITPLLSANIPSHDYEIFGHAARGNNLTEARFGLQLGKALTFPKAGYAHASYEYGWVENFADVSNDRSVVTGALGFFITPRLQVGAFGLYNYTHDGLAWSEKISMTVTSTRTMRPRRRDTGAWARTWASC